MLFTCIPELNTSQVFVQGSLRRDAFVSDGSRRFDGTETHSRRGTADKERKVNSASVIRIMCFFLYSCACVFEFVRANVCNIYVY
jgi:hypothetical protein